MTSHSRDMVGAIKNLNGSRDITTPLSATVCHPWAGTCTVILPNKFEVSTFTHYKDMKGDTKYRKLGGLG